MAFVKPSLLSRNNLIEVLKMGAVEQKLEFQRSIDEGNGKKKTF